MCNAEAEPICGLGSFYWEIFDDVYIDDLINFSAVKIYPSNLYEYVIIVFFLRVRNSAKKYDIVSIKKR